MTLGFPKPEKPEEKARVPIRPRCRHCKKSYRYHMGPGVLHGGGSCPGYSPKRPPPKNKLPRGHRKSDLGAAKRTLWARFSDYVRARDGRTCFTCDKVATDEDVRAGKLQAGHMFPGRTGALLFDPLVVKSQCASCNKGKNGMTAVFIARYIALHGIEQFELVVKRTSREKQWRTHEIRELIEALKQGPAQYEALYEQKHGQVDEARTGLTEEDGHAGEETGSTEGQGRPENPAPGARAGDREPA